MKLNLLALVMLVFSFSFESFAAQRYIIKGLKGPKASKAVTQAGGVFKKSLRYHNASVAELPFAALVNLSNRFPQIEFEIDHEVSLVARPDRGGNGGGDSTPPPQVVPWGISQIGAIQAHATNRGAGVIVCVVDTGIDNDHPDLVDNIVGGENFVARKGRVDASAWDDDNDHGTHVAGTIAAVDNNQGVIGVAPSASLFAVKVLDRRGSGYTSDVADGVVSCALNGAHVINMSLGSSQSNTLLQSAIIQAASTGSIIVAAAGNDGGVVGYPAAYPEVIAISAVDINNQIAYFSNRGPEIDFAAPGVDILSTVKGGGYASFNGTSMASPHAAGVFALQISAGTSSVKADDIGLSYLLQGFGLVNAFRTVTEL